MRSRRHRVTSAEPTPACDAPDELISVVRLLRGITAASVGQVRLRGWQGQGSRDADDGPVAFEPSLSSREVPKAPCKHTGHIPFRPDWQCAGLANRLGGSVTIGIRTTQEQQVAHGRPSWMRPSSPRRDERCMKAGFNQSLLGATVFRWTLLQRSLAVSPLDRARHPRQRSSAHASPRRLQRPFRCAIDPPK